MTTRRPRLVSKAALTERNEWMLLLLIVLTPVGMVLAMAPNDAALATAAEVAGLVGGLLLMVAALLSYLTWRIRNDPREGWLVAVLMPVTAQVTVMSGYALAPDGIGVTDNTWALLSCAVMSSIVSVVAAVGLRVRSHSMPDPLAVGLGLALIAMAMRSAVTFIDAPAPAAMAPVLIALILISHVWLAVAVTLTRSLPRWIVQRLAATFILIGLGLVGPVGGNLATLVGNSVRAAAAVILTASAFILLDKSFARMRARTASLESWLLDVETSARSSQERLHEVKSTIAGLASAAGLLHDEDIAPHTRVRLERTVRAELERLQRLVAGERSDASTVDLDDTLEVLLQAHRARGRQIAWEPSGAQIEASHDAVAEAVNILLENMAVHGGPGGRINVTAADGVVAIEVSDQGPGVPAELRSKIFEWGESRPDSPGQGIGLNLARRLVVEQGGSLDLDHDVDAGSSFVIKLPAARRAPHLEVLEFRDVDAS